MKYLKNLCAALVVAGAMTSCDMMTDDRDYCPTGLYVSFDYDYNLQRADMFNDHVGAVTLYVFDADGRLVKTQEDYNTPVAAPLKAPGYMMHVTGLAPGKYKFLALAGQTSYREQLATRRAKFVRTDMPAGSSMTSLGVALECREAADGMYVVDNAGLPLDTLWHGVYTSPVEVYEEKPTYATIPLVRDTKHISVALRELDDPTTMDIANYDMAIVDRNAALLWDNAVDESKTVRYTPYAKWNTADKTGALLPDGELSGGIGRIGHADFMTSRIICHDDAAADGVLFVKNILTGATVASINLPDVLSRLRSYEETHLYSAQEFLDRGYDYDLELFLIGGKLSYLNVSISVLGWSCRVQVEEL